VEKERELRCVLVVTHGVDPVVRHVWLDLGRDDIRLPHHTDVILKVPVQQRGVHRPRTKRTEPSEVEERVVGDEDLRVV
jgi:hypothetical protein